MTFQIETPIEKAKRLLVNAEILVSSENWRELVGNLLLEIEALELAVADACMGEYGDTALISSVRSTAAKIKEKLNEQR